MIDPAYYAVLTQLVAPIILAVVLVAVVVAALYQQLGGLSFREVLGFTLPFAFLGGISGLIAGATSEPIVGAFLTGLLGVVSGVLTLSLAKQPAAGPYPPPQPAPEIRHLVGPSIVVLCLTALAGLAIGRVYQTQWINYERAYAQTRELNEKVNMPLARIWKQHEYCRTRVKDPTSCDALLLTAN